MRGLLGVVVPLALSLFVSVLLAGRRLSVIRLGVSVIASQTLFHSLFVLGTALLGHPFWNMVDPERSANMTQFLKNMGTLGGLLLLAVSGPGRFSVDGR